MRLPWNKNKDRLAYLYERMDEMITKHNKLTDQVKDLKAEVDKSLAVKKISSNIVETVLRKIREEFSNKESTTPIS